MTIRNGDLPASPIVEESKSIQYNNETFTQALMVSFGLTKREYFAALAMQGILSCDNSEFSHVAASRAAECADALLLELERTK